MPVALIWLIAALALAGAEALTGDLFLLMLSGGALAAAGSQPAVRRPLGRRRRVPGRVGAAAGAGAAGAAQATSPSGTGLPEPMKALEGKSALVLDRVARHEGQVKLDGEVWTARPLNDDDVYEPGDHVTVMHIDGATAVVSKSRLEKPGRLREGTRHGRCRRRPDLRGGAGDVRRSSSSPSRSR